MYRDPRCRCKLCVNDWPESLKSQCVNKLQSLLTTYSNFRCKNKLSISKFTRLESQRKETSVSYQ